jgi:hypothetical protein
MEESLPNQRHHSTAATALVLAVIASVGASGQSQPAPPASQASVPLKVTITIARYQGEKRISSLPYVLSVNENSVTKVRMGTKVPVTTGVVTPSANKLGTTYTYQDVGTNIDCQVHYRENGLFGVSVVIDDSSVYLDDKASQSAAQSGRPSFRSFSVNQSVLLKDGESASLASVPDKVSGEIVKVDVALAVIK